MPSRCSSSLIAVATIWLFLTNPVIFAIAAKKVKSRRSVRNLADVLLQALEGVLNPGINDEPTAQDVVEHSLRARPTRSTLSRCCGRSTPGWSEAAQFENPKAVLDYIDFFIPAIEEVVQSRSHRRRRSWSA